MLASVRLLAAVFLVSLSTASAWVTPGALPLPLSRSASQINSKRGGRPRVGNGVSGVRAQNFMGWEWGAEKGKSISELLGIISCDASHILVKGDDAKENCELLKELIAMSINLPAGIGLEGAFEMVAREHSQCPSSNKGGSLGTFKPGQMVREFDTVAFNSPIGKVMGPVVTQFGAHLILVKGRTGDPAPKKKGGCG